MENQESAARMDQAPELTLLRAGTALGVVFGAEDRRWKQDPNRASADTRAALAATPNRRDKIGRATSRTKSKSERATCGRQN
jgi:hypothetical protein